MNRPLKLRVLEPEGTVPGGGPAPPARERNEILTRGNATGVAVPGMTPGGDGQERGPADEGGWASAASRVLVEQMPGAVAVLDRELRYLAVNSRWRTEFQLEGLSVCGQSHYQLFPDLHPAWSELYERRCPRRRASDR